ncbi:type II toxin-antitoxin system HicB family antitoxin [Geoglobus acetivorans]|uniref:Type II toxin-antitoxin system HicB family antitoxin n=1 Tax=Geoglobus acetivorans TaxID=565033 RepID=A0ABZ3H1A6_GEOAI|nr:type II toxin-antitoxin system HicB family antitoxin [Geoglobus acetivorans]
MRLYAVLWKEGNLFFIKEFFTGVTTQGETMDKAVENMREAARMYLEKMPEVLEEIEERDVIGVINVEIDTLFDENLFESENSI